MAAVPAEWRQARACAIRGHKVRLYEKNVLGGTLNAPATAEFKIQIRKLIEYYKVQLNKLGVEIHEYTELSIDSPILAECDRIVCATGSKPLSLPIPGINGSNVLGVIDAHLKPELVTGRNLIICGGGMVWAATFALEAMTALGRKATVIEMKDDVATDVIMMNQISLKESMAESGVALRCGCRVKEITGNGVVVINKDGGEELIEGDQVISAFGQTPDKDMVNKLQGQIL